MATLTVGYDAAGVQKTHATIADAYAAAAANDTLELHYSDATRNIAWNEVVSNGVTTKGVSVISGLGRPVIIKMGGNTYFQRLEGNLSGLAQVVYRQLVFISGYASGGNWVVGNWNDTTGGGGGILMDRCESFGGQVFLFAYNGDADVCEARNCTTFGTARLLWSFGSAAKAHFCSAYFADTAFDANNEASTLHNCAAYKAATACYANTGSATFTKCASTDATGSEAGLRSLTDTDFDAWDENDNGFYAPNGRILATSALYRAGTAIAGVTTDRDGSTRHETTPSIGSHEGTATPYGITHPTAGNVLTGSGTFEAWAGTITPSYSPDFPEVGKVLDTETVNGVPGTFANIAESKVKQGEQWGEDGTEYTGTFAPDYPDAGNVTEDDTVNSVAGTYHEATAAEVQSGVTFGAGGTEHTGTFAPTAPAAPDIAVARASDTSCTVTFSNSAVGVTNEVRYATTGDGGDTWVDGGDRSGDGAVTVSGLVNGQVYFIVGFSTKAGAYSEPSNVVIYTSGPASGATGTYAKFLAALYDEIRNSAALAAKGGSSTHVYLGRKVHKTADADEPDDLLATAPVHHIIGLGVTASPRSEDSARLEARAQVLVTEKIDQSASDTLLVATNYIDALRQEMMSEADGTGGGSSWLSPIGANLRIEVDGPHDDEKLNVVQTVLTVTAALHEGV